ncbi:MAG: hypothetical protein ACKO23_20230 [Gemmataceae bacterium]
MFGWIFEGNWTAYVIVVSIMILLGALWLRDRRKEWLYAVAVFAGLLGLLFLLDYMVETRQEQVERKLVEMADSVRKHDVDHIFRHISDKFQFQSLNKVGFRKYVESTFNRGWIDDMVVWGFQPVDRQGIVTFYAKPKGSITGKDVPYLVRAKFIEEARGEWKLESFQIFNPVVDTNRPLDLPTLQ